VYGRILDNGRIETTLHSDARGIACRTTFASCKVKNCCADYANNDAGVSSLGTAGKVPYPCLPAPKKGSIRRMACLCL
jgi:hypothetical protein